MGSLCGETPGELGAEAGEEGRSVGEPEPERDRFGDVAPGALACLDLASSPLRKGWKIGCRTFFRPGSRAGQLYSAARDLE
jgi:hypothetical protein